MAARYGAKTKQFTRYYTVPGYGHGTGVFNLAWNSVAALDSWVAKGEAPGHPVAYNGTTPGRARRPPCQYPGRPRYRDHGDVDMASSFSCVTADPPAVGRRRGDGRRHHRTNGHKRFPGQPDMSSPV